MSKLPPCKDGKKHSWKWVKDKIITKKVQYNGYSPTIRLSVRSLYQCQNCPAKKVGRPGVNSRGQAARKIGDDYDYDQGN